MISLPHYLTVGVILFGLGLIGFLTRRNLITMFLCAEMMLLGTVLNLLAFGRFHGSIDGQVFGLFIIAVAACESGLALALFLTLYRRVKSLDASVWQEIRESGVPPATDVEPLSRPETEPDDPVLTPAGQRPDAAVEEAARA